MSAGIPLGSKANEDFNEMQLNDLKRALPSEIARVTTLICKLEKELQQLEECRLDLTENLFSGLEPTDGIGDGLRQDDKANVRNLHVWRRLNEFKSDIKGEKKNIEREVLRVESQLAKLRESKQWLTDMSISINHININGKPSRDSCSRLVSDFKNYLRKKIGLGKLERAELDCKKRDAKGELDIAWSTFGR